MEPYLFMWVLAAGSFFVLKGITTTAIDRPVSGGRLLLYLFVWPGLQPKEFLYRQPRTTVFFRSALFQIGVGGMLFFVVARTAGGGIVTAWIGMVGLALMIHFGTFRLLAALFLRRGIQATPLMNRPLFARTVAEFWGHRWNRAFRDFAHRYLFLPLRRKVGVGMATVLVFFLSGIVHELVISVPAGGGYGLPTAYFLLQPIGIGLERKMGKHRLFPILFTFLPAVILFHPTFVEVVVLPMMKAWGAL